MSKPSTSLPEGAPHSLQQAHQVFLAGCGLPMAWADQTQWRVLETGFGDGLNFLATWAAWQADPQRPRMLHFTAVAPCPASATELRNAALAYPQLHPLAEQLATRFYGLLPGVHRLVFEDSLVQLTLWIGDAQAMLRQQTMVADSIYLSSADSDTWDAHHLKALARHCRRGTRLAGMLNASAMRDQLVQCGFALHQVVNEDAEHQDLQASFNPAWEPRVRAQVGPEPVTQPGTALIIGAGLAGSAAAHSLALRGWQVTVLAQGDSPADGASGLPAGLFCPHVSPDDSVLSRLSRNGVRQTLQRLHDLCREGQDWAPSGVLEHCTDGGTGLPASWAGGPGDDWSHAASPEQLARAGLAPDTVACWHQQAGWVRPAQLVQAQLNHPLIRFQPLATVAQLQRMANRWQALDTQGQPLAEADMVVLACGPATAGLLPADLHWPLQAIRGQISWGRHCADNAAALPPFPVNGNGNLVTQIPLPQGPSWVMGSTFERDVTALPISAADQAAAHAVNHGKLSTLLPASAATMVPWFDPQDARCQPTWGRVRVASHDRLPIAGPVLDAAGQACPGLWALTALGARGLTLSVLCAELLAARLHGEPLPLDAKLAQHLGTERLQRHMPS
ncbi:MAG: FAD-dependent 5-carboxymethylaminomethyl-2-thiouridine(34) oxidoreductase MnmC [Acidovorax sp.]|jgi:tRNA 5-methylaminomethyl-2-thiouridine biosynthesis bifunctional protein|nr:FAD-dependent 5-carboxymethylaminomethyl-2-thiouridine(34) oxidoreductase MnmC [Acidovorax sp.]